MSQTPIADMVATLLASGVKPSVIVEAVRTVEAIRSRSSMRNARLERARALSRDRQRRYRERQRQKKSFPPTVGGVQ